MVEKVFKRIHLGTVIFCQKFCNVSMSISIRKVARREINEILHDFATSNKNSSMPYITEIEFEISLQLLKIYL